MGDLHRIDGLGLAHLIAAGTVSAAEVTEAAIARVEALNPGLNAVITPMFDQARANAGTGPFAGVPFLLKDLAVAWPGVPLSAGSAAQRAWVPTVECSQAAALRRAGFVVLGKTNTPELGASALTNPRAFGPTRNPWDRRLNSGGSSGGSAAAVAARMVPLAFGSDGGGSIRLPASHCGVFGFKPGRGVNPHDPPDAWAGAVVGHPLTISVRDSAAFLEAMTGTPGRFLGHLNASPRCLRIALCLDSPAGRPVAAECIAATERLAALLADLGHRVEVVALPYDGRALLRSFLTVVLACTGRDVDRLAEQVGVARRRLDIEPDTRALAEVGRGVPAAELAAARAHWDRVAADMVAFFTRHDVLLTPVAATGPLPHDGLDPPFLVGLARRVLVSLGLGPALYGPTLLDQAIDDTLGRLPFTQLANCAGLPAASVPGYWTDAGLPVGAQLIGPAGGDGRILALAAQIEQAAPWADRLPPDCA